MMLIGFIGAPGCGKSTTAFGLCYRLKQQGYPVEFFAEYARFQIMQCRLKGIEGNGGLDGQRVIYAQDSANALLYLDQTEIISVTDGSTVNCHFYGLDDLDLLAETRKYDVLFYIPAIDVPLVDHDANRMQNRQEILHMAQRWEDRIRMLMPAAHNIIELQGYPHRTTEQMLDDVWAALEARFFAKKRAA